MVPKDPDPVVVQNACLNNANRVINVGGYNFTMSRYTTTFYTTIGSTGIYGNYVTILDGKPVSINNSFTHFVKDGVLKPSNGSSIKDATIVASGTTVSFANIDNDPTKVYAVGTGQYDVRFDTAPKGACLARYTSSMGDYSGGYPVLVLP